MNDEKRKEIDVMSATMDMLMLMAEGNPGAVTVLAQLMKADEGILLILGLDDMNIRGTQIWIGFKDYCGNDIKKFSKCILERDKGMVEKINQEGLRGNHNHKAVEGGAAFETPGRQFLKATKPNPPKRMIRLD